MYSWIEISERIELRKPEAIANGVGKNYRDQAKAIKDSHDKGVTDEFIEPVMFKNTMA